MQDTFQQRLDFVGLGDGVADRLAPVAENAARHLEQALQRFSAQVSATPSAARFLYGRERIEGDGGGPSAHWRALLAGQIDRDFAEASSRTGQRQARIGVEPRWAAGSHSIIVQELVRGVIRDGVAQLIKPRRGPLGLLGAPDAISVQDGADALANGVATLVGAVMADLDFCFSGYAERLRLDGEARLEAQQGRLHQGIAMAGSLLERAAEGRRDFPDMASDDPDLAPLRAGAEKLADKVVSLLDDLETAGSAARALGAEVLAGGQALLAGQGAQRELVQRLERQLAQAAPRAADLPPRLGALVRRGKALARRCVRHRRDLMAATGSVSEPIGGDPAALIERIDGLGLAANLVAARLAQGAAVDQGLDGDLHAIALGLAQVSAQLRAEGDRRAGATGNADQAARRMVSLLEQIGADLGADAALLAALERDSLVLAAGCAEANGMAAALVDTAGQGEAAVERIEAALAGAGALAVLAEAFDGSGPVGLDNDEPPVHAVFDHEAIAAHWHVG